MNLGRGRRRGLEGKIPSPNPVVPVQLLSGCHRQRTGLDAVFYMLDPAVVEWMEGRVLLPLE